jgi:pyridoxal 5'-phosphate synthase pdxT subunit
MKIGVLALQGAFIEHIHILRRLGADPLEVRLPDQLEGLAGLILPGGESTTMVKMADAFGLMEPLRAFGQTRAVWGTCAGAILMARTILMDTIDRPQPSLDLMDIAVRRNAFGRQVDSFEMDLHAPVLAAHVPAAHVPDANESGENPPFHAVFIRAPLIERVYGAAEALACLPDGRIVAAKQGHLLATSFHPELTGDSRFHQFFLALCR